MCEARCDTKRTDCGKFAYEYPRRQPITSRHWPACVSTRNTASTTAKTQQRARLFLGLLLEREPAAPPTAHARYSLSLSIFDWVMCFESLSPFPSIRSISSLFISLPSDDLLFLSTTRSLSFQAPFPSAHWPSHSIRIRTFSFDALLSNGHSVLFRFDNVPSTHTLR